MNFNFIATYVDLLDIPTYTTSVALEGQVLRVSFVWNERIGKRTIFITNSVGECYLQNTILHPNEPFELNSNAVFDDVPYTVTLIKTGDSKRVGNIFDWSKDFILCFSRTVDLDVKKLNVVYGVTTPSSPILPKPFGDWILNQGYEIVGNDIKYTAYKTNSLNYYDSFALADLVQTLVKSFHDPDLQQYAAFTTAVEQLLGSVDWVLDPANNRIKYYEIDDPNQADYIWWIGDRSRWGTCYSESSCAAVYMTWMTGFENAINPTSECKKNGTSMVCTGTANGSRRFNNTMSGTAQNPSAEKEEKYLPLQVVAQKVISNADSSADEVLKLLSEDYINLVANSVFDSNPSKRFVKLEDLIPQLEANKVLR